MNAGSISAATVAALVAGVPSGSGARGSVPRGSGPGGTPQPPVPGATPRSGQPAYRELAIRLRHLIGDGRIPVGTRLPSERDLPVALGVSRTTVTRAYAVLRDGGYLASRRGSGSVAQLPGGALPAHGPLIARPSDASTIDLTYAALPASAGTLQAYERALSVLPRYLAVPGYDPVGLPETRAAIAGWFAGRGLATDADQIVVTTGANAALAAAAQALGRPGQRVVMETPTYANAIHTLTAARLRPTGVPMIGGADVGYAWDVDTFAATLRRSGAPLAYLMPDFHNPTGALMPAGQRAELVDVAARVGATLIADETFVDLPLDLTDAEMPAPLAACGDGVITIGGTSKAFWGGVRVGWIRLPSTLPTSRAKSSATGAELGSVRALRDQVLYARHCLDLGTPILEQLVTVELLAARVEIMRERREALRRQRDVLLSELRVALPEWECSAPTGGVNVWCELPRPVASGLVRAAQPLGLLLAAGGRFAVGGGMESRLRLPYTVGEDRLREAVRRLRQAWDVASETTPPETPWPPLVA